VTDASSGSAATRSFRCRPLVSDVLGGIAKRIYAQASTGANVKSSRRRLARSAVLARAVAAGDPAATRAALRPLLKGQIRDIAVRRNGRRLAELRTKGAALGPSHGVIRNSDGRIVGRYVMAVSTQRALRSVTSELTGAHVIIRRAGDRPAERPGTTRVSFGAHAFPSGRLRVYLEIPSSAATACAPTAAQTVMQTVELVGERLFHTEVRGPQALRVLNHVAADARFRNAVVTDDAAALRTAIIRFFRTHSLHVVRIRATTADGRLVNDVGGPYVLAPTSRRLRDAAGNVIGRVTLSVQDDTGYIKLMHRFTGADVLLRTPNGQVPGSSLDPGPPTLPAGGTVAYRGRSYEVAEFQAQAFPDGPLDIYLLVPLPATP